MFIAVPDNEHYKSTSDMFAFPLSSLPHFLPEVICRQMGLMQPPVDVF